MATRHKYRRSDLFLLRMWTEEPGEAGDSSGKVEWHGKLQRATDGESHNFKGLQSLVELLGDMLSRSNRR